MRPREPARPPRRRGTSRSANPPPCVRGRGPPQWRCSASSRSSSLSLRLQLPDSSSSTTCAGASAPRPHSFRARRCYDAGDYERARERFLEAVTLDPTTTKRALSSAGRSTSSANTGRPSSASRPPSGGNRAGKAFTTGLGWSRLHLKRYHLAAEAFRAALDLNPDYADARIGLGSALFELSRYDEALASLQAAARRLEPLVGARAARRGERSRQDRVEPPLPEPASAGAPVLRARAPRSRPDWHGLHNGIGWCHLKLGQKAEARAAFQRALELKPDYADALEGLRQASGLRSAPS